MKDKLHLVKYLVPDTDKTTKHQVRHERFYSYTDINVLVAKIAGLALVGTDFPRWDDHCTWVE